MEATESRTQPYDAEDLQIFTSLLGFRYPTQNVGRYTALQKQESLDRI